MVPKFCPNCGHEVTVRQKIQKKSKGRITAEKKMAELEEIRPRLEAAWDAYFAVRVAYEDRLQFLAVYHKRELVSDEEYEKYRIRSNGNSFKKEINDAVKAYRAAKREDEEE